MQTGSRFKAEVNRDLIKSIFFKNSPLHDGAIVISQNQIIAARCILPVSHRTDLPEEMGMRHRAAIGVTEVTDAVAIVVSEQSGSISVVDHGTIHKNLNLSELEALLKSNFA